MGKKMMHIGLEPGAVGRYVFLPGSPERTEKIAAYFDDPKEIAYNREFRTFVGELDGVKVAVTLSLIHISRPFIRFSIRLMSFSVAFLTVNLSFIKNPPAYIDLL